VIYNLPDVGFDPGNTTQSMSNSFWDLPVAAIETALRIRKEIEALQASVIDILGGDRGEAPQPSATPAPVKAGRGKMSAAGRARIATAQKARWAKAKGEGPAAVKPAINGAKKKRFVSPEARAKMAAAQKARWAKKPGASTPAKPAAKAPRKKHTMSPEARAKIAAAQKARWAKQKAA
jgi:hypothetical protein